MRERVSDADAQALTVDPMATQWEKAYAHDLLDARERIREYKNEWESCCERERARWETEKELRARVKDLEGEVERCAGELFYEARHLRGVLRGKE